MSKEPLGEIHMGAHNTSDSDALATRPDFGRTITAEENNNNTIDLLVNGRSFATIINEEDDEVTDEMRAYAALFTAAPDMLAALKAVKSLFVETSPFVIRKISSPITNGDQKLIDDAFIALDAAISKAERGA